jgi:hypothetical protein
VTEAGLFTLYGLGLLDLIPLEATFKLPGDVYGLQVLEQYSEDPVILTTQKVLGLSQPIKGDFLNCAWGCLPFLFIIEVVFPFFWGRLSSLVKIRLHINYQVMLQLMLRLSWAVTIIVPLSLPWSFNALLSLNSLSSKVTFGQNPHPLFDFVFYQMM